LALQNDRWHPDVQSKFGLDNLKEMYNLHHRQYGFGKELKSFNKSIVDEMVACVKVNTFVHAFMYKINFAL
jgi:hypothetical protein